MVMEFLVWAVVPAIAAVLARLVVVPYRRLRAGAMTRRASAGRSVVLPARLGLLDRNLAPRGALVRDGKELLWISRRPLGRAVRLPPALIADEGRRLGWSDAAMLDWTVVEHEVRTGQRSVLSVAEWYAPVLAAMRRTPAQAPHRAVVAAAVPRWVVLLPVAALLGFSPLLLAWANGVPVDAVVTGHDVEYETCEVEWTAAGVRNSAEVDCNLESLGSTLTVRALGFPMSGDAADLAWTLETVGWLLALPVLLSAVCLAVHLPVVLRMPTIDPAAPQPVRTRAGRGRRRGTEQVAVEPPASWPWQQRALEWAATVGVRPRHERRRTDRGRADRWLSAAQAVCSASPGYLAGAVACLGMAAVLVGFSVSATRTLAAGARSLVEVEVVEAGDRELPILTRQSLVATEAGEELWLTTWRQLQDGETVTVLRAEDTLALPGDPGHRIDLAEGAGLAVPGVVCAVVLWRRSRAVLAQLSGGSGSDHEDVEYAAFCFADGTNLLVLLEPDGEPGLTLEVLSAIAPVGVARVPRSRQKGQRVAAVVRGRTTAPVAPAQRLTAAELNDLLDPQD